MAKNIKSKKKRSCNCSTENPSPNEMVVLFIPLLTTRNDGTMNICITWYIDCSYSFEDEHDDDNTTFVTWPLNEECIQGVDALTNNLDECCQRTLSERETSRDSLVVQVPRQYAACALRPLMRVVIDASYQDCFDGYHTIPNLTDELILERTTLFCRKGYDIAMGRHATTTPIVTTTHHCKNRL